MCIRDSDTSDYSFGYVAGWSSGKEMTELKTSLETIQATAKELITEIEGHFTELQQQRQAEQEQQLSLIHIYLPERKRAAWRRGQLRAAYAAIS